MKWINYLWRALAALGEADELFAYAGQARPWQECSIDLSDDAAVRAAFRSIVEREWGIVLRDRSPRRYPDNKPRRTPPDRPVTP
ncbi:hypothetical protein ACI2K4_26190 [Micromonospora sp. NPDC050397]|uniref:hypothetical protein n=1 Tax=Micromonospora sp. NPDC050397 TaxID=3364279 RepID=UPI00384FDD79